MPEGNSKIMNGGQSGVNWDSAACNMILVNERMRFIDRHIENKQSDLFFAYVATSSAHAPNSPAKNHINGSPAENAKSAAHMGMLCEVDLVLGSSMKALEDRNSIEDAIIVFTSDNRGLGKGTGDTEFGHESNGGPRGIKGSLYEGGHCAPMIMQCDRGLPLGETCESIVRVRKNNTNNLSNCIVIPMELAFFIL